MLNIVLLWFGYCNCQYCNFLFFKWSHVLYGWTKSTLSSLHAHWYWPHAPIKRPPPCPRSRLFLGVIPQPPAPLAGLWPYTFFFISRARFEGFLWDFDLCIHPASIQLNPYHHQPREPRHQDGYFQHVIHYRLLQTTHQMLPSCCEWRPSGTKNTHLNSFLFQSVIISICHYRRLSKKQHSVISSQTSVGYQNISQTCIKYIGIRQVKIYLF